MTGYTATDMSTAAANGFRDRSLAVAHGANIDAMISLADRLHSSKSHNQGDYERGRIAGLQHAGDCLRVLIKASTKGGEEGEQLRRAYDVIEGLVCSLNEAAAAGTRIKPRDVADLEVSIRATLGKSWQATSTCAEQSE